MRYLLVFLLRCAALGILLAGCVIAMDKKLDSAGILVIFTTLVTLAGILAPSQPVASDEK